VSITALAACLLALECIRLPGADGDEQLLSSALHTVECTYGDVLKPSSVEEVQRIVREARESGRRVRALGNRHSLNDIICTGGEDDVAIDMGGFTGVEVAPDKKTATMGAGAELEDVLTRLETEGLTMLSLTQFSGLTLGGVMGTGGHGSTLIHPTSSSDQATKMTLVDGRGDVVIVDGDLLKSARLHLGVMGVVVNVTLPVRDLIKLRVETQVLGEEAILSGQNIFERVQSADFVTIMWLHEQKKVIVSEGVAVPVESEDEDTAFSPSYAEIRDASLRAHAQRNATFFCSLAMGPLQNFTLTGNFGSMATSSCDKPEFCAYDTPWQDLSIAVDLRDLPAALRRAHQVMDAMATCMPSWLIRFHRASENHMSMAWGADKAIIDLAFPIPVAPDEPAVFLGPAQAVFQVLVHEFGAVPHWAKNGPAFWGKNFAPAAERFPRLAAFLEDMRSMDPDGVFQNAFFRRVLGKAEVEKFPGCALTAKCICDEDAHCGRDQVCVTPTLPYRRETGAMDGEDSRSKIRVCSFL